MAVPVTIPRATLSLEEANILAWKKAAGSPVLKDEILFEMETDKVVVEVPAPVTGWLLRIDVAEGLAKVEQPVGWIGAMGEVLDDPVPAGVQPGGTAAPAAIPPRQAPGIERSATPAARRRSRELGVNLDGVRGTGPGGRITEKDVEAAADGGEG